VSHLSRRIRALRRQLEIVILALLAGMLALLRRLRRGSGPLARGGGQQARWLAAGVAVLVLAVAGVVALLPHSTSHPVAEQTRPSAAPAVTDEPSAPPVGLLSSQAFAGAARRAPATAPLQRLPQVDLNGLSVAGIPPAALAAYVTAARTTTRTAPGCRVHWWLLAGVGLVESGHARSGGSTKPKWDGIARPPIYGPALDGSHGFAAIRDTDGGAFDHDKSWDRAVGPMQFLPSTWRTWGGTDKHGHVRDPQDIRAAALAAAGYLCAGGADLSQPEGMATAVYSYNHSFDYVRLVLSVAAKYAGVDPNALGVNRLPHDKPAKKKRRSTATASPSAAASPRSGGSGPSASPSPSSHPSSASPSPSPSGPSIPPLLTPTSVVH
jgi:hypothetical protein